MLSFKKNRTLKKNLMINLLVRKAIFIFFIISSAALAFPAYSYTRNLPEVDGYLLSGTSLFEYQDESYGQKLYPSIGVGISLLFPEEKRIELGVDFFYQYNFRSNYTNLYYYGKYHTLALQPIIVYYLKRGTSCIWIFLRGGINYSFSRYIGTFYPSLSGGAGISFTSRFLKGALLEYSHSFVSGVKLYETLYFRLIIKLKK